MRQRALAIAILVGCGSGHGNHVYDALEVDPPVAMVTVPLDATATQAYQVFGITDGVRTDITSACVLAVDPLFGAFPIGSGTMTVNPHGGKTIVKAACGSLAGNAELMVNLNGTVIVGTAPANSGDLFTMATLGTDPARAPLLQYPLDQAVSPRNIPPIEIQWGAAGNDLFHVALTTTFAAVDVYTTDVQATLSATQWESIAGTAAGENLGFSVEGLVQASPATKYAGAGATIAMSNDIIDKTAIYYWASSQGDVMTQTFGDVNAPSVVQGNCTACHSLSRAGTRIGYSRCVANDCNRLYTGFMHYDPGTNTWVDTVNADSQTIHGSFTTFSPLGNPFQTDAASVAIVTMVNGSLSLFDPDTGAAIASNLDAVSQHGPGAPRSALMAYWSAGGGSVVYASTPHPNQWIDLSDSAIVTSTYTFTAGAHMFGEPQFIVSNPITLPSGIYQNFFFPSFSPDDQLIVFDAARSAWRDGTDAYRPGARLMLTDPAGATVRDLTALNGGASASTDVTWAHWAPTVSSDYYWLVFSSEHDYGHESTAATAPASCINVGVHQCKQIWIGAISRNKLVGSGDPSAPPMWLPGQDPKADNISPYWTVPAAVQ